IGTGKNTEFNMQFIDAILSLEITAYMKEKAS
ncbi:unnamed protein product, partial [marine sediment metagenome]